MPYTPVSKPGAIGNDMPAALKGNIEGSIAGNFQGRPRNAFPNYPHNPDNSKPIHQWTQDHMQSQRKKKDNK